MLFPTIRFALFFAVVMPASWILMPLPGGRRQMAADQDQPWLIPASLLALAAVLGPLAPWSSPTAVVVLGWVAALGLGGLAIVRWLDLTGLVRWNVFMLVASYVFYGAYDWHFVMVLAGSTVANQLLTTRLHRSDDERTRRLLLVAGVAANLGVLGWFKYKGFFLESASSIFAPLGWEITPPASALLPPVGISFFTFQALSYVIDTYRRRIEPSPLLDFAVYLSFFPHLVAGPIVRAAEFLPQLREPRDARRVDTGLAFWLIAAGLFKKVVVSSYLADAIVDPVFRLPVQHQAADTLLGIYGYAIQIYCDFSGYTDMAIGLALLLGFRFPQNFDAPYTAVTLQDFWRRWHMTLSRWLRDYLYIPMGGSQRGPRRAYLNLFLTMLIGGLWHGAAWTFVVWGALHGGYLAFERWWKSESTGGLEPLVRLRAWQAARPPVSPARRAWMGRLITFHVVCLGWVFFRAPTFKEAVSVLTRLTAIGTGTGVNLVVVATIVVFLASQFVPTDAVGRAQARFSLLAPWQQGLALAGFILVTNALSPTGVAPFIYFAF